MSFFTKAKSAVTIVGLMLTAFFSPTGDGQVKSVFKHQTNDRRERLRDSNRLELQRRATPEIGNSGPKP